MAGTGPENLFRSPVEKFTLRLLQYAAANPSLISRSGDAWLRNLDTRCELRPLPLPSDALAVFPGSSARQYFEDVASIAVSAAQQAEETLAQAHLRSRTARRRTIAAVVFGAVSLMAGAAGFTAQQIAQTKLSALTSQIQILQAQQLTTREQLAALRSATDHLTAEAEQAEAAPIPVSIKPLPPTTYEASPSVRINSTPWPDSVPYRPRRTAARHRTPPPPFLVAINRGLRALFH